MHLIVMQFKFLMLALIQYNDKLPISFGLIDRLINPLHNLFGIECNVALDRNLGPRYDTSLLRLISGDL